MGFSNLIIAQVPPIDANASIFCQSIFVGPSAAEMTAFNTIFVIAAIAACAGSYMAVRGFAEPTRPAPPDSR